MLLRSSPISFNVPFPFPNSARLEILGAFTPPPWYSYDVFMILYDNWLVDLLIHTSYRALGVGQLPLPLLRLFSREVLDSWTAHEASGAFSPILALL